MPWIGMASMVAKMRAHSRCWGNADLHQSRWIKFH